MELLVIFLGIVFGIILFLGFVYFILKRKLTGYIGKFGYSNFSSLYKDVKKSSEEFMTTPKHVSGMTKLIIPNIVRDFPNFSESELYNKVETSLLLIFESLETKKIKTNDELILIREKLKSQIEDLKESKIDLEYSDVVFHKSALKSYKNKDGVLNITVETSLEYYYKKSVNGKIKEEYKEYKKQTKYTTDFIYVYNPEKLPKYQTLIGISCPNCGAALKKLGEKYCEYCHSGLEDINLKSWHIALFKES